MKKVYEKPEIMFEDFTLSVNIAGDCEKTTNTPSQMQCGYGEDEFGYAIFITGVSGCKSVQADGFGSICYHNPSASENLFNS